MQASDAMNRWSQLLAESEAAVDAGELFQAERLLNQALELVETAGLERGQAGHVLVMLSILRKIQGLPEAALKLLVEADQEYEHSGADFVENRVIVLVAQAAMLQPMEKIPEAIKQLETAIELAKAGNLSLDLDLNGALEELRQVGGLQQSSSTSNTNESDSDLEVLHHQMINFYEQNRRYLGASINLTYEVAEGYDYFTAMFSAAKFNWPFQKTYGFTSCIHGCRYQLLMGILCLLRGQRTDSATYTRKAIEFAAFGVAMLRKPPVEAEKSNKPLYERWFNACESKTAFANYRDNFRITHLVKALSNLSPGIDNRYENLSALVHPSILSVTGHSRLEILCGTLFHQYHYFDQEDEERNRLAVLTFFSILETHLEILKGMGAGLAEAAPQFRLDTFAAKLNAVANQVRQEMKYWAEEFKQSRTRP